MLVWDSNNTKGALLMLQKLSDVELSNISGGGREKTNLGSCDDNSNGKHCTFCKRLLSGSEFCVSMPFITASNTTVRWFPLVGKFCSATCAKKYSNSIPTIFELQSGDNKEPINLIKAPYKKCRIFRNFNS